MYEKIVEIIRRYSQIPVEKITPDMYLDEDLDLNSIELVELIVEFEDIFDVEIPDKEIYKIRRISDIVDFLEAEAKRK